jgi:hypothetical protein
MSDKKVEFVKAREQLLNAITAYLRTDERFVAAWLAGSYGRGQQNWTSDLDLHVVVGETYCEQLCAKPWMSGAHTTPERQALFEQFGTPVIVFEAHSNNQLGGTFTYVLYEESAHNVDWMLIPQKLAYREAQTLLLFDKFGLPPTEAVEPESQSARVERLSNTVGFFWMIAAANVGTLLNGDLSEFHRNLLWMDGNIRDVEAGVRGEFAPYISHMHSQVFATDEARAMALRQRCNEMECLMPAVLEMGGYLPTNPRAVVEKRLDLLAGA